MELLAIEWLKIKRYRTFWILMGFFVLLLPLWNYAVNAGFMKFGGADINILSQAYSFENVWGNVSFWTSYFVIFLAILTIILTTNEYNFKTNRQNIIDGQSRLQFFHAKWLLVLTLSVFTTVFMFIVGLCFGVANNGLSGFPGDLSHLFYIFLLSLNYYAFALLLAFFLKRSGITIGIFFLYCMIMESLIQKIINMKFDTHVADYLPLQSSDELFHLPLIEMVKAMIPGRVGPPQWSYVLASVCWIAVYYIVGRKKLLSSDW